MQTSTQPELTWDDAQVLAQAAGWDRAEKLKRYAGLERWVHYVRLWRGDCAWEMHVSRGLDAAQIVVAMLEEDARTGYGQAVTYNALGKYEFGWQDPRAIFGKSTC